MDMGVLVILFKLMSLFLSDKYLEGDWGNSTLFFIVAASIHIPTNSGQRFPFLHILSNTFYFLSFWQQLFWQVWSYSSLWFWFAIPWRITTLSIFSGAYWPSRCLLRKNVYSDLLPIFKSHCFFATEFMSSLYILDINPWNIWFANNFLPFIRLSFIFVNSLLCCAEVF